MKFNFLKFLKSFAFFSGVLKAISVLICLGLGWFFKDPFAGLTGGLTIVMVSPADIPGNRRHQILGIVIATIFVAISGLAVNLAQDNIYVLVPIMAILVFFYAYICLYGNRASMVALAGIFSISLTFAKLRTGQEIYYSAFYTLLAGAGYIFLMQIYMWIKPRQYSEKILGNCMAITAEFFNTRADLILFPDNFSYKKKLVSLQTSLSEGFENLRELLFDYQSKSGKTSYLQRQFLIFIELVDVFEVAMSNPIPYQGIKKYFDKDSDFLIDYSDLLRDFADNLKDMSVYIGSRKSFVPKDKIKKSLRKFNNSIKLLSKEQDVDFEKIRLLKSLHDYLKVQSEKIETMETIFSNYYNNDGDKRDVRVWKKFVSNRSYSPKRLLDHLSIHSTFFRHAIRLSLVTVLGYLIGYWFELLNGYWILFTAYVIMRPGFAVTKQRSRQRIIGTAIGIGVVTSIVVLCQFILGLDYGTYSKIYGAIAALCMPFAYGMLQDNFSLCVVFITTYIMLIFAIFVPNIDEVIVYRVIDTFIGVGLSLASNYLIFPSWEKKSFITLLNNSKFKNSEYIKAVIKRAKTYCGATTEYKVARKKAFLALASLNSGFQRLVQEPKRDKNEDNKISELVVLQQDFLSCTAAIALQLPQQKTPGEFPMDVLEEVLEGIRRKLMGEESEVDIEYILEAIKDSDNESVVNLLYYEQLSYLYQLSKKISEIKIK